MLVLNITKPSIDSREYVGLTLSNDIKVVIISDESSNLSSAALSVNVGSTSDPVEIPGLAHFCEHMLFMGTEKYPCENHFSNFIKENGGVSNASTSAHCTTFAYKIKNECFIESLEIFSEFFKSPLFLDDSAEREIKAVDSEHQKNLKCDDRRMFAILKNILGKEAGFDQFSTGNEETLSTNLKMKDLNIIEKLKEFHRDNYSSNLMTLVILTNQDGSSLVPIIRQHFQTIPNKDKSPKSFEYDLCKKNTGTIIYIEPVKSKNTIKLFWPMPSYSDNYKAKPDAYATWLLGHEGHDGLDHYLKEKELVFSSASGAQHLVKGIDALYFIAEVTDLGMERYQEIVDAVYQYIKMLQSNKINERILEEIKLSRKLTFLYKSNREPFATVYSLSQELRKTEIQDVLSGSLLIEETDMDLIDKVLSHLNPQNMLIMLSSQKLAEKCDQTEYYYKTKYGCESLDKDYLKKLENLPVEDWFKFPRKNEYFPENLSLEDYNKEFNENYAEEVERVLQLEGAHRFQHTIPQLLMSNNMFRLWFRQDCEFRLPLIISSLHVQLPLMNENPHEYLYLKMFIELFEKEMDKESYELECARFKFSAEAKHDAVNITCFGFSDKYLANFEKLLKKFFLKDFPMKPETFNLIKEGLLKECINFKAKRLFETCLFDFSNLMLSNGLSNEQEEAYIRDLTLDKFKDVAGSIFNHAFIDFMIQGNIKHEKAMQFSETLIKDIFNCVDVNQDPSLFKPCKNVDLNKVDKLPCIYRSIGSVHPDSCIIYYVQMGVKNQLNYTLTVLLEQLLSEDFFNSMRTNKQLGYITALNCRVFKTHVGLLFIIQSKYDPDLLKTYIDEFIVESWTKLQEMSDERFERVKNSVFKKSHQKYDSLQTLAESQFHSITAQNYIFTGRNIIANCVCKITKEILLNFFKDNMYDARKAIIVQNHSKDIIDNLETLASSNCTILKTFKDLPESVYSSIDEIENEFRKDFLKFKPSNRP